MGEMFLAVPEVKKNPGSAASAAKKSPVTAVTD